jgi:hypothetical protein
VWKFQNYVLRKTQLLSLCIKKIRYNIVLIKNIMLILISYWKFTYKKIKYFELFIKETCNKEKKSKLKVKKKW